MRRSTNQLALLEMPNDPYTRINLGLLRLSRGQISEGMAEMRRAVDSEPTWGLTHHWLAIAHRQTGNKELASRESLRAAELEPRNAEYVYTAARDLQLIGDAEGSLPFLLELSSLVGEYNDSLFLEAFARQETGRPDLAIELYQRFLEKSPNHYQAQFNLGFALKGRGNLERAAEAFERCLDGNPRYHECHFHLAECYRRLNQPSKAAEHQRLYDEARKDRGGG